MTFRIKPKGVWKTIAVLGVMEAVIWAICFFVIADEEQGIPLGLIGVFAFSMLVSIFIGAMFVRVAVKSYLEIRDKVLYVGTFGENATKFVEGQVPLAEVVRIQPVRRIIMAGRNNSVAYGIYCYDAQGRNIYLPLSHYTGDQRAALYAAMREANPAIEQEQQITERDMRARAANFNWTQGGEADLAPDGVRWDDESPRQTAQQGTVPTEEQIAVDVDDGVIWASEAEREQSRNHVYSTADPNAILFRYTPFEGKKAVKCSQCGVRIAAITQPGEHEIAGYVCTQGKPQWVCSACWERYREEKHWQEG